MKKLQVTSLLLSKIDYLHYYIKYNNVFQSGQVNIFPAY